VLVDSIERLAMQARDNQAAWEDYCTTPFEHVLGALWGDPSSGGNYRTALDDCADWAYIRDAFNAALDVRAAA
jgi:hypothetical protein